jgi:hypothetical protein
MTPTQFETLRWLRDVGGVAVAFGEKIVSPKYLERETRRRKSKDYTAGAHLGDHEYTKPAVSALHLVQRGCIEARGGQLHITERGRAELKP